MTCKVETSSADNDEIASHAREEPSLNAVKANEEDGAEDGGTGAGQSTWTRPSSRMAMRITSSSLSSRSDDFPQGSDFKASCSTSRLVNSMPLQDSPRTIGAQEELGNSLQDPTPCRTCKCCPGGLAGQLKVAFLWEASGRKCPPGATPFTLSARRTSRSASPHDLLPLPRQPPPASTPCLNSGPWHMQ